MYQYIYIYILHKFNNVCFNDKKKTYDAEICAYDAVPFDWIPFGDHPLKLERYRED